MQAGGCKAIKMGLISFVLGKIRRPLGKGFKFVGCNSQAHAYLS